MSGQSEASVTKDSLVTVLSPVDTTGLEEKEIKSLETIREAVQQADEKYKARLDKLEKEVLAYTNSSEYKKYLELDALVKENRAGEGPTLGPSEQALYTKVGNQLEQFKSNKQKLIDHSSTQLAQLQESYYTAYAKCRELRAKREKKSKELDEQIAALERDIAKREQLVKGDQFSLKHGGLNRVSRRIVERRLAKNKFYLEKYYRRRLARRIAIKEGTAESLRKRPDSPIDDEGWSSQSEPDEHSARRLNVKRGRPRQPPAKTQADYELEDRLEEQRLQKEHEKEQRRKQKQADQEHKDQDEEELVGLFPDLTPNLTPNLSPNISPRRTPDTDRENSDTDSEPDMDGRRPRWSLRDPNLQDLKKIKKAPLFI